MGDNKWTQKKTMLCSIPLRPVAVLIHFIVNANGQRNNDGKLPSSSRLVKQWMRSHEKNVISQRKQTKKGKNHRGNWVWIYVKCINIS